MMQHKIMLRHDEVKDFVTHASKSPYDIDIFYNSFIVFCINLRIYRRVFRCLEQFFDPWCIRIGFYKGINGKN